MIVSPYRAARHAPSGMRRLRLEPLEDRRLLDAGLASSLAEVATPWHNSTRAFDVNNSDIVSPIDALIVINHLILDGSGPLVGNPNGNNFIDTNGDNMLSALDALKVINRLNSPPQVTVSTLAPFTVDLTPQITVVAGSPAAIPDGTLIKLDVDLDGDGNFFSPGESAYATPTMIGGKAVFDLAPGLPANGPSGPYTVRLRARVTDFDGIEGVSPLDPLLVDTQISNALKNYVTAPDPTYAYAQNGSPNVGLGFTRYVLDLTSQTWRTTADVNRTVWQHWVEVFVPTGAVASTALLFIDGGSNSPNPPASSGLSSQILGGLAAQAHAVVVDLHQVPNQSLTFTGDPGNPRKEDDIIAYTFDQYLSHIGEPGNETWPALLPMVKSAVKAMDAAQQFLNVDLGSATPINDFIVTGYSKRGWTTWLTAAVDDRVKAIIPGVFDVLNLGPQLAHHYGAYGFFADAIQSYNDLHVFDRILSPAGGQLSKIIDPYSYLNNGRFTIPKLIINGTQDEFFLPDASQFYIHDLPGTKNYLRYIPNADHGLNTTDPVNSTLTFMDAILNNRPLPQFSWTVQANGSIHVQTVTAPTIVKLWQATDTVGRDFRRLQRHPSDPIVPVWTSSTLSNQGGGVYIGSVPTPATGATAFMVELTFPSAIPGRPYVFTTEVHVMTNQPLFAWPFSVAGTLAAASPNAANSAMLSNSAANDVAFALVTTAGAASPPLGDQNEQGVSPPLAAAQPQMLTTARPQAAPAVVLAWSSAVDDPVDAWTSPDELPDAAAVDEVFGADLLAATA